VKNGAAVLIEADAIVIGAGPAGSTAADEIAKKGYNVALIEVDSYPGEESVCGAVAPRSVTDEFEIPGSVIERTISKFMCYFPSETFSFNLPFSCFQRCNFDRFLGERAASHGARLITNTLATDVSLLEDSVSVTLHSKKENSDYQMRAQIVVFADGAATLGARKFKGVGYQRRPERTIHGLLYELEWPNTPLDTLDLYFDDGIAPWGYGWIFPKKDLINVGIGSLFAVAGASKGPGMKERLDYFVKEHGDVPRKLAGRKVIRLQAAIIPAEPAPKIYSKRMVFVGDAAGMVEPFSGGGNEYAMRAARLAGKVVNESLKKKKFDEKFLSRYQDAWEKSNDGKMLRYMQQWFSSGLLKFQTDKNAAIKTYLDFFHAVATQNA
jgi:geranylgeranyl reductase family protein